MLRKLIVVAILLFSSKIYAQEKSDEQYWKFFGGIGDKIFSLIESEAERRHREREALIDKLTDSSGKLSPENLKLLSEYDKKYDDEDFNQTNKQIENLNTNIFNLGKKVRDENNQALEIQEKKLDIIIKEARSALNAKDYIAARINIIKIEWIPIGNKEIDEHQYNKYRNIKDILNSEIQEN